ncbi:MAG: DASS family sodium-coupled anion symporter [Okeania sp. SIO2C2]|uniref:SLC13 family permease n=1 Tax=Okeania sp. SIO2C2 TaxID=2607787 RepID=UPI0013B849CB|nr:DASS family sodium-coupled anion symporter [Okeania sp. SIO2C2]NEP87750.1 DASS family sodium-coupled anion symporter [Okeania sp. SIO2C2]
MENIRHLRSWLRISRQPQYRWLWFVAAALIYVSILLFPMAGIEKEAKGALAVFGVTAFLWATNTLPVAVTGLMVLFLIPLSGSMSPTETYAYFGNKAVFFVLGAFILASPIQRSGLSTRLALTVVSRFGNTQNTLIASILILSAIMSFVISSYAVTAMLFPVVIEVIQAAGAKPGGRFGLAAFLALGWGCGIGGIATLLGGARAPLALGVLRSTTNGEYDVSFVEWFIWSIPLVVLLLTVAYFILLQIGKGTVVSLPNALKFLKIRSKSLGGISPREIGTLVLVAGIVLLWIFRGTAWGLDTIAFFGVMCSFIFGLASWQEVEEDVNWGIFLMYGSAIALSAVLRDTGAAQALAEILLGSWINSGLICFVAMVLIITILTEGMSNAAAVAVLMPVGLALAAKYGIDPRAMTLGITLPSGLAFLLPVSTPVMAIIIGSGYVSPAEAFKRGLLLKLVGTLIFLAMAKFYWPLFGLGV